MFSGNTIKQLICITAVLSCLCMMASCSFPATNNHVKPTNDQVNPTDSGNSTDTSVPNYTVPDGYIRNSVVPDGEFGGRVYKDQLILNIDGKQYLAVGLFADPEEEYPFLGARYGNDVYYSEEDIKSLKVGDEFRFDSDIQFEIKSLDETDWKPPLRDVPNGKIILNDDFCLIHGPYERDNNDIIVDYSKSDKWILTTECNIKTGNIGISPVFKHVLYEISDKCIFTMCEQGDMGNDRTIGWEEANKIFEGRDDICSRFAYCSFVVRRNQIVAGRFIVGDIT